MKILAKVNIKQLLKKQRYDLGLTLSGGGAIGFAKIFESWLPVKNSEKLTIPTVVCISLKHNSTLWQIN